MWIGLTKSKCWNIQQALFLFIHSPSQMCFCFPPPCRIFLFRLSTHIKKHFLTFSCTLFHILHPHMQLFKDESPCTSVIVWLFGWEPSVCAYVNFCVLIYLPVPHSCSVYNLRVEGGPRSSRQVDISAFSQCCCWRSSCFKSQMWPLARSTSSCPLKVCTVETSVPISLISCKPLKPFE